MKTTLTLEIVEDGGIWLHADGAGITPIGSIHDGLVAVVMSFATASVVKQVAESLALRMAEEASGPLPALEEEG